MLPLKTRLKEGAQDLLQHPHIMSGKIFFLWILFHG